MRHVLISIGVLTLFLASALLAPLPALYAQETGTCPTIVGEAVTITANACTAIGRNEVCYGYNIVTASPQTGQPAFTFEQSGDIVAVDTLDTLRLASMDAAQSIWGVALMRLQASLPDTLPGQNVTFVLAGDVQIQNAVEADAAPVVPATLPATALSNANLRAGPSTSHNVTGALASGEAITLDGRLADNTWFRLQRADGGAAWVFAQLIQLAEDPTSLSILTGDEAPAGQVYGPMQAFYMTTGLGDAPCAEAPASGIVVQTPKGAGSVTFNVNGLELALGSTAIFQGGGAGQMDVWLLQGNVQPLNPPPDTTTQLPGQAQTWVMQNGQYVPDGAPWDFPADEANKYPLDLLPDPVYVPQRGTTNCTDYGVPLDVNWSLIAPRVSLIYDIFSDGQTLFKASYSRYTSPSGNMIAFHTARANRDDFLWAVPTIVDQGGAVLLPDMPGHGETGGPVNWDWWPPTADCLVNQMQAMGYTGGTLAGSSFGADTAIVGCVNNPDWCNSVAAFSPGDYGNWGIPATLNALGDTPVSIYGATGDQDPSLLRNYAMQTATGTLNIYDSSGHGTGIRETNPEITTDFNTWLDGVSPSTGTLTCSNTPYLDELTIGIERELFEDWSLGIRFIKKDDVGVLYANADMSAGGTGSYTFITPTMPDDPSTWPAAADCLLNHAAQQDQGGSVLVGTGIGANIAAWTCAQNADICNGALLFDPVEDGLNDLLNPVTGEPIDWHLDPSADRINDTPIWTFSTNDPLPPVIQDALNN